nr:glycerol 3 phosphate dehydrogenase 1 [Hymenolepis microstoma]
MVAGWSGNLQFTWSDDVSIVEICGALNSILTVTAGVVDGLRLGANTKSAIIRLGHGRGRNKWVSSTTRCRLVSEEIGRLTDSNPPSIMVLTQLVDLRVESLSLENGFKFT